MRLHDVAADGQAEAHAAALGCDEGLKEPRRHGFGEARAGVGDIDLDELAVPGAGNPDLQPADLAPFHRFHSIAHQVRHHLLNLNPVQDCARQRACRFEYSTHARARCDRRNEFDRLPRDVFDRLRLAVGFAASHLIAQPLHDLARAGALLQDLVDHSACNRVAFFFGHPTERACVVGNRRQRLVEFMRQSRRHHAHRVPARQMDQFRLKILETFLRAFAFADIAHDCGAAEDPAGSVIDRRDGHRHVDIDPILSAPAGFEFVNRLAGPQTFENSIVFLQQIGREDRRDGASDHLFGRVAEHFLRRRVPAEHNSVESLRENCIVRRCDDACEQKAVALQPRVFLDLVGECAVCRAEFRNDTVLLAKLPQMASVRARPHKLGHVFHAMDNPSELACAVQHRCVERAPVPDLETAAFRIRTADIVFLQSHRVGAKTGLHAGKRGLQIRGACCVGFVRIVRKHIEEAPADDLVAFRHRRGAIGVADGNDRETRIEHEVKAWSAFEQRPEIGFDIRPVQDTGPWRPSPACRSRSAPHRCRVRR